MKSLRLLWLVSALVVLSGCNTSGGAGTTSTLRAKIKASGDIVNFSPDGKTIVLLNQTGTDTYRLDLVDTATGQVRHKLENIPTLWRAAVFTADGQTLIVYTSDGVFFDMMNAKRYTRPQE